MVALCWQIIPMMFGDDGLLKKDFLELSAQVFLVFVAVAFPIKIFKKRGKPISEKAMTPILFLFWTSVGIFIISLFLVLLNATASFISILSDMGERKITMYNHFIFWSSLEMALWTFWFKKHESKKTKK
jgi:glucan phosphoethanolaminetransferase (alkaline phosphatase superfamily)